MCTCLNNLRSLAVPSPCNGRGCPAANARPIQVIQQHNKLMALTATSIVGWLVVLAIVAVGAWASACVKGISNPFPYFVLDGLVSGFGSLLLWIWFRQPPRTHITL